MSSQPWRLVYVSRNDVVGGDRVRMEVDRILATARRRNPSMGVTGALLFNQNRFAQVLEGPQEAIQDLFTRIQLDERHSEVHLLAFEEVTERTFASWSMAFVGEDSEAARRFSEIGGDADFLVERLDGELIFDLMRLHLLEHEADTELTELTGRDDDRLEPAEWEAVASSFDVPEG